MRFTRDEIQRVKEAELRLKVLKPLLEKLGFNDVFHSHGVSEKGKDFVMWKLGELGERINYAVVAKAERITGKADTRPGSAGNVAVQIRQAFGSTYLDRVTSEEQRVHQCWVITPKEISKEAVDSITAELRSSNLDRCVRFIDGDLLWKLIQENFPESAALENLNAMSKILENLDPDWRVVVSNRGGNQNFSVEPKHPESKPLQQKLRFKFPDNDEGKAKFKEFQDFIEKGTDIVLEAPYLVGVEMPEFLRGFVGEPKKVELKPNHLAKPVQISLSVVSDDGATFSLEPLEFRLQRGGTKEAIFTTAHQGRPWAFEMRIVAPNRLASFTWSFHASKGNVHRIYQGVRLWHALTKPGTIAMEFTETGVRLGHLRTDRMQASAEPPDKVLLQLMEALDFIQSSTGQELFLPKEAVTMKDFKRMIWLAGLLRSGRANATHFKSTSRCNRAAAETALQGGSKKEVHPLVSYSENYCEEVLRQPVKLGRVVTYIKAGRPSPKNLSNLKRELNDTRKQEFSVQFESVGDSEVNLFYLKALPPTAELPDEVREILKAHS